ncbi:MULTISPECIES: ComF family protein [Bartonella]|uniref:ComF family protein n=1 Tax=Bartonella TaxID=773 RepID=UPI0018DBBC98|nr:MULTISPECIES: ComF family protein [Bartonella]MBH9974225.1 ComF family protein [Bartonella choladocola]MBI0013832.1 ComF family protein [Bartonella sp. B10834G3]
MNLLFPPTCPGCGCFVDKNGTICPECWQKLHFITKPYCPIMGTPFTYDPGDVFFSGEAIQSPPPFGRARSVVAHFGLARTLVARLKYGDRTDLAPSMAEWMVTAGKELIDSADMIVPVPLHYRRFLKRKYNQATELSRHIANRTGKPLEPLVLMRRKNTRQQVGLVKKARQRNMIGAFRVPEKQKEKIRDKHILLIDDVFTTGATLRSATKALLRGGAESVDVLTFSRVIPDLYEDLAS